MRTCRPSCYFHHHGAKRGGSAINPKSGTLSSSLLSGTCTSVHVHVPLLAPCVPTYTISASHRKSVRLYASELFAILLRVLLADSDMTTYPDIAESARNAPILAHWAMSSILSFNALPYSLCVRPTVASSLAPLPVPLVSRPSQGHSVCVRRSGHYA